MSMREGHTAAENSSQPNSKTFEQIVYYSTSVAGNQTNIHWNSDLNNVAKGKYLQI